MPNEAEAYLDKMKQTIRQLQDELKKKMTAANTIAEMEGITPPPYPDVEGQTAAVATVFRSDEFYGQPLATCVRRILEARRAMNLGPASVTELHDALVGGGYKFDTKDEVNSKNSLRVSLGKNPLFHKLPQGTWGLLSWYPKAKQPKDSVSTEKPPDTAAQDEAGAQADEEGGDEK